MQVARGKRLAEAAYCREFDSWSSAMKTSTNGQHLKKEATPKSLEARVASLEAEMARLKQFPATATAVGFESIVGSQADNPFFESVVREMKRQRDQDYAQARQETKAVRKPAPKRRALAGVK